METKKITKFDIFVLIGLLGWAFFIGYIYFNKLNFVSGATLPASSYVTSANTAQNITGAKLNDVGATTTLTYFTTSTATTTLATLNTADLDRLPVNVWFVASSSGSTLFLSCQYSDNRVDWYDSDCFSTSLYTRTLATTIDASSTSGISTTTLLPAATTTIQVTPGFAGSGGVRTATSSYHIVLPVSSEWTRINASVGNNNGGVFLYARIRALR